MKRISIRVSCLTFIIAVLSATAAFEANAGTVRPRAESGALINSISGTVWDPNGSPVPDLYVELMNDLFSSLARQRTTSTGQFNFVGVSSGSFKVKVITTGTNFMEQTQDVQVINLTQGSSDAVYVDFRLRYDPRRFTIGSDGAAENIFVQEGIPDEAQKLYKRGIALLDRKDESGLAELESAIRLFPNYFDANYRLGREYVDRKEFQKALDYLIRAIDVNQRSFDSYYALGFSCFQLGKIEAATVAARAATVLRPTSVNALLLYGTVLRLGGDYAQAEKTLAQAKKNAKDPVAQIHWQLALVLNKLNRNKEAADELEVFLKLQPNAPDRKQIEETIAKLRGSKK